jgi:hypothetical protein
VTAAAILLLGREEWGADPSLPRLGRAVDRAARTEVFVHHTAVVDPDATPNEWRDLAEVKARMRVLQTIRREDLGADVPYSFVAFCMADGRLVLAEGRGLDRSGAHTAGHNRSALGIAFQGDFEAGPPPARLDDRLAALGDWLRRLRLEEGFARLGSHRPPGRQLWGHRDVKATQCPGRLLFERLGTIRFRDEDDDRVSRVEETAMDEATWKRVQRGLQALEPPLYAGKDIDGRPGRFTHASLQAFERRMDLEPRGVIGALGDPAAGIWPATRELLFVHALLPRGPGS